MKRPEFKPVGYICTHCSHWEGKEQEVMCLKCGIGEMVYQSENKAWNDCHKAHDPYIAYQDQRIKELEDSVGELVGALEDVYQTIEHDITESKAIVFTVLDKHQKKGVRDEVS